MPHPLPAPLQSVVEAATLAFVDGVSADAACRFEAKVASREGMPLLCAVEAALARSRLTLSAQELVWLSAAPEAEGHVLRLKAFGPDNQLLAEEVHAFAACRAVSRTPSCEEEQRE